MPMLIIRHGFAALGWWPLIVMLVVLPLSGFAVSLSMTMRATPALMLRRMHRGLYPLGLAQTLVTLMIGVLGAMFAAWSWTMAIDVLLDLLSGRDSRLAGPWSQVPDGFSGTLGFMGRALSDLAFKDLISPMGGVLMMSVLLWLMVHRFLRHSILPTLWLVTPVFGGILLMAILALLAAWSSPLPPFAAVPQLSEGQGGGSGLAMLVDVTTCAMLAVALGSGLLGQWYGLQARRVDIMDSIISSSLWSMALWLIWLMAVGMLLTYGLYLQGDPGSVMVGGLELLMLRLPMAVVAATGSGALAALLVVLVLLVLGLWGLITTLLTVHVTIHSVRQDFQLSYREAQTRVVIAGLLLSLPFATLGGPALWTLLLDGLRLIVLPALSIMVLVMVNKYLGLDGIVGMVRHYSVIPVSSHWVMVIKVILPLFLLLVMITGAAMALGWQNGGWSWPRLLTLLPMTLVLVLIGFATVKRGVR